MFFLFSHEMLTLHEMRRVHDCDACCNASVVVRCGLCAENVSCGMVHHDVLLHDIAEKDGKDAELGDAFHILARMAVAQHCGHHLGRENALHQNISAALLLAHGLEHAHKIVLIVVVAAAFALWLEHILFRLSKRHRHNLAGFLVVRIQRIQTSKRLHQQPGILLVQIALKHLERGHNLLHLLGAHKLIAERRTLDRIRELNRLARAPLLFCRVVLGLVSGAVVCDADAEPVDCEHPCLGVKLPLLRNLRKGLADHPRVELGPQLVCNVALVEKVALAGLHNHHHHCGLLVGVVEPACSCESFGDQMEAFCVREIVRIDPGQHPELCKVAVHV
eukprot:comp18538_c0_seq1/m.33314 comp18538_c0_seq1/g.33314  ORF comp18538_c0_seq1/g.33314 comp18538_c0_seq1/m.33314 type:complete len:333 (+) comp18538_c0_seq1:34-1032(+)